MGLMLIILMDIMVQWVIIHHIILIPALMPGVLRLTGPTDPLLPQEPITPIPVQWPGAGRYQPLMERAVQRRPTIPIQEPLVLPGRDLGLMDRREHLFTRMVMAPPHKLPMQPITMVKPSPEREIRMVVRRLQPVARMAVVA